MLLRNRWVRRVLLAVAVAALVGGGARLAGVAEPGRWLPPLTVPLPGGIAPYVPGGCSRDPADLPAPPVAPDGRPANYLHTCGSQIYDSHGRVVKITGLNWSGMETADHAPGGLGNRNWQEILDQIAALGYNTIRVPFSDETLEPSQHVGNVNFVLNPDLQDLSGLEMLDRLIAGARARGLKVILDRHQPTSSGPTELWYDADVPTDRWIADWRMLARRYAGDDTVIGVDLANEPHGPATWGSGDPATDWRLAAEQAANAVLAVNPYLLVFVEGVGDYQGDHFWWGGNLLGVRTAPVRPRVPNRVVYSPHDYGPAISGQTWFWDPRFPANLPAEWDRHWGYIQEEGIAPIVVGEFGGRSLGSDPDGQWQRALLAYLRAHDDGFLVWSLNPTWDTGGILDASWQTVDPARQQAYQTLLAPPLDTGRGGAFGRAPAQLMVLFQQDGNGGAPDEVRFAFRIFDDGPTRIDLSRLELRYWFRATALDPGTARVSIESGALAGATVRADVVPTTRGGQGYYLRIRFAPGSGSIERYRETGPVTIRFQKPRSLSSASLNDYSFAGAPSTPGQFAAWDRVTLYLDSRLAWGREP